MTNTSNQEASPPSEQRPRITEDCLKNYMLKEIDIIQEIIKRMAYNSFMIKGWTVTLVVVTLLLKKTDLQVWIALIPLIGFWYLDAYFLHQERMYRVLYRWIVDKRLENSDEYLFNMDASRFKHEVDSRIKTMISITLFWFYGLIFCLIVIYLIIVNWSGDVQNLSLS